jgi:hypothetical protein
MELDRGKLGQMLMVLAGVVSLLSIGMFPAGWVIYAETGGKRVYEDGGIDWVGVLLSCSTIAAGLLAVISLKFYRRGSWTACRIALLLSIVLGLAAAVPAAFSLAAFIAVRPTMGGFRTN